VRVRELRREEITVYTAPGVPKQIVVVTYQAEDLPPRTVWIDKEKFTEALLHEVIREDVRKAKEFVPREFTI